MWDLEYIEEEEVEKESVNSAVFFPCLEILELKTIPSLKGWLRRIVQQQQLLCFPVLSLFKAQFCPSLEYMPSCPRLCELKTNLVGGVMMERLMSSTLSSLQVCTIENAHKLEILHLALRNLQHVSIAMCDSLTQLQIEGSPSLIDVEIHNCGLTQLQFGGSPNLQHVIIGQCDSLTQLHIEAPTPSLSSLILNNCPELKDLHIVHPDALETLKIINCPQLSLSSCIDWDSLLNISCLQLRPLPPLEELPQCLLHRQALGHLRIYDRKIQFLTTTSLL